MLTLEETLARLLVAAFLGAIVGFEREKHSQPAGLRTHIILTVGATIAMCLSINISAQFKGITTNGDPERIAAQVVSGIGFLGAGAIFRFGSSVKGLTTAASLWTMAMVGLAVGAGYYWLSFSSTLLVILVLVVLDFFEKKFIHAKQTKTVTIMGLDRSGFVEEVRELLGTFNFKIKNINFTKDVENNSIEIEAVAKILPSQNLDRMIGVFSKTEGIKKFTLR